MSEPTPAIDENLSSDRALPVQTDALCRAHLRLGWVWLLVFVTMGIALETMHGLKLGFYLDVGNEMRRLMWTLAHAHGVGLGLLHLGFAATVRFLGEEGYGMASQLLTWGAVLLPAGFFLGGLGTFEGDPGVGVFLVPVGALLLWVSVLLVARRILGR